MKKLRVALVAGTMPMYPGVAGSIYSKYQKDLLSLSAELDFELVIYKELITDENQAKSIAGEYLSFRKQFPNLRHGHFAQKIFAGFDDAVDQGFLFLLQGIDFIFNCPFGD